MKIKLIRDHHHKEHDGSLLTLSYIIDRPHLKLNEKTYNSKTTVSYYKIDFTYKLNMKFIGKSSDLKINDELFKEIEIAAWLGLDQSHYLWLPYIY